MAEHFEDLESWELMIESRQYRSVSSTRQLNLRSVADFAFVDLLSLYILHNEYETAPVAARYADKTIGFRNFTKPRLGGTDLYLSLNILTNPDSIFSKKISQNAEADAILRDKIKLNLPTVKRYMDLLADGKITSADAAQLLLRLEKQLNITDSQLRSMRRLAQDWPNLTQMQREILVTRMLQFYRKHAKRSELMVFLEDLGKSKGYEIRGPIDAELKNLGYGAADVVKAALPWVGLLASTVGAYKLGKSLVSPVEKDK
jgi:hypothetical protein